ncbi:T6SS phospholipase effector Tle1-like catalytic domain-containing protein [Marinomonas mediterranea]|uniref:T6SS phospholipase effector Tle1-like catalytic domain-containing protein n=1 Tax=Marinomonas mediterranea TaxID=119864 RepID=UPI00234AEC55|nr:DUF2235 domain-containing protein [Marinomonas mediterranea]WCN09608.1 hypothetical protein GV055_12085 [Marinomonas mediterranea]
MSRKKQDVSALPVRIRDFILSRGYSLNPLEWVATYAYPAQMDQFRVEFSHLHFFIIESGGQVRFLERHKPTLSGRVYEVRQKEISDSPKPAKPREKLNRPAPVYVRDEYPQTNEAAGVIPTPSDRSKYFAQLTYQYPGEGTVQVPYHIHSGEQTFTGGSLSASRIPLQEDGDVTYELGEPVTSVQWQEHRRAIEQTVAALSQRIVELQPKPNHNWPRKVQRLHLIDNGLIEPGDSSYMDESFFKDESLLHNAFEYARTIWDERRICKPERFRKAFIQSLEQGVTLDAFSHYLSSSFGIQYSSGPAVGLHLANAFLDLIYILDKPSLLESLYSTARHHQISKPDEWIKEVVLVALLCQKASLIMSRPENNQLIAFHELRELGRTLHEGVRLICQQNLVRTLTAPISQPQTLIVPVPSIDPHQWHYEAGPDHSLPERTFRLGVFFDGTGQNRINDEYKEKRGDTSRTNVARLFELYPIIPGRSDKIYIQGIGTRDLDDLTPEARAAIIDEGDDLCLNSSVSGFGDEGSVYCKWQLLLKSYRKLIKSLSDEGHYHAITHIEFDVFGFSRGAALARHFVNALQAGLPDYEAPNTGGSEYDYAYARYGKPLKNTIDSTIEPNLLGQPEPFVYDKDRVPLSIDRHRRHTVRFVGLFDSVGSFGMPGDDDDDPFELSLKAHQAKRIYQITACYEYRKNFPLTSVFTKGRARPDNIFEEAFPGCHTDVGGGYPYRDQYFNTKLPEYYEVPVITSYNRELEKVGASEEYHPRSGSQITSDRIRKQYEQEWRAQCEREYADGHAGATGVVKAWRGHYYFYRIYPVNVSLAGLSMLRMKQQGHVMGIEWLEEDYDKVKNTDFHSHAFIPKLWKYLKTFPIGTIQEVNWQGVAWHTDVHRSHELSISPGYDSFIKKNVDGIDNRTQFIIQEPMPVHLRPRPIRRIFDND